MYEHTPSLQGISYLVVLAVIGWSIATKATTGSGLPAGPSGLLGAVEGVSYLSLLGGEMQVAAHGVWCGSNSPLTTARVCIDISSELHVAQDCQHVQGECWLEHVSPEGSGICNCNWPKCMCCLCTLMGILHS